MPLTLTIFDWDDTLLCSSHLFRNPEGLTRSSWQQNASRRGLQASLKVLGQHVYDCLCQALRCGPVAIITNAEHGWVESSCLKFLPCVSPLLTHVTVVSARQLYAHVSPNPAQWKLWAFNVYVTEVFSRHHQSEPNRVVSIGDSECERSALFSLGGAHPSTILVSFKLQETPAVHLLAQELEFLSSILSTTVLSSDCHLNLAYTDCN
mmetsp:Transcript_34756/g.56765  ORF Transcript_34756/g.56765 Transcript_34756/m.56765 type:complete len:207 (+) Transcript_34756:80-700(+)